jgi:hypothetical protein
MNELRKKWPDDPSKTSADLPGSGEPGFGLQDAKWLLKVIESKESISEAMIDDLLKKSRASGDTAFTMPDNGNPVTADEARGKYRDLFAQREKKYGKEEAYESLLVADADNSLKFFAEKMSLGSSCPIVVLGHTHAPVESYEEPIFYGDNYLYCNSGFCCPCEPAQKSHKKVSTFVEVESVSNRDKITVWKTENGKLSVLKEKEIKF